MKLWEVLKALEENPNMRFEHESGNQELYMQGGLKIRELDRRILFYMHDWTEVKQPVTWQEALEAWVNGKTIKSFHEGNEAIYQGGRNFLTCRDGMHVDKDEIKYGTWYIEN